MPEYHYTEDFGVCPVIFSYDMVSSKVLILSPRTAICVQPNFSFVGPVFSTSFGLKVLVERLPAKREPEQTVPVNITYKLSFGRRGSKILDNVEDFLFSLGGIEVDYWLIPSELAPPTAKAGD